MTDAQLGAYLAPEESSAIQMRLVQALGEKRGIYERLALAGDEIALWQAGVMPRPAGVILCHPRRSRGSAP